MGELTLESVAARVAELERKVGSSTGGEAEPSARQFSPALQPLVPDIIALYRELPALLADGHEGKFAVVVDGTLRGVFESDDEAYETGFALAGLGKPFLSQPIKRSDLVNLAPYMPPVSA